jgi:hypothetical protein
MHEDKGDIYMYSIESMSIESIPRQTKRESPSFTVLSVLGYSFCLSYDSLESPSSLPVFIFLCFYLCSYIPDLKLFEFLFVFILYLL